MAIEIKNQNLFGKIIADALVAVELNNSLTSETKIRWWNAIGRAAEMIDNQPEFLEYHPELNMLTVWNQETNKVYNANGVCECRAGQLGQPCKHRAAKQLIKSYLAALNTPPMVKGAAASPAPAAAFDITKAPYLPPSRNYKPQTLGGVRF